MTPKEKAKELVNRFGYYSDPYHYGQPNENIHFFRITNAKKCALICIDETLNFAYKFENYEYPYDYNEQDREEIKFLLEVKQEIEKL